MLCYNCRLRSIAPTHAPQANKKINAIFIEPILLKALLMKKLIFTLYTFSLAVVANAQFQLSYYNAAGQYPGSTVIKTDMTHRLDLNGGGIPNLAPVNGSYWDFSSAQYLNTIDYTAYDTNTSVVFIPAEYTGTVVYYLTPFLPYTTQPKFEIRTIGTFTYGEHIDRQAYTLGLFTGDNNDSIVILNQDIMYSSPLTNMPYPAAPGISAWASIFSYNTAMSFTYTAQSYNQAPVTKVSHVVRVDSAAAAGKIRSLRDDNTQGGWIDVLQIMSTTVTQDSFYVNGNPMPGNVLSQFGLSQGMMSTVYQYSFYRAGEVTPLLNAFYNDAQFTDLHSANLHRQRMPDGTSVADVRKAGSLIIYPNPAGNDINFVLDKGLNRADYSLINVTGQVVAAGSAEAGNGVAHITVTDVPAGMYYIRLSSKGEILGQSPVVITK